MNLLMPGNAGKLGGVGVLRVLLIRLHNVQIVFRVYPQFEKCSYWRAATFLLMCASR
jgi:hypothetical protein